MNPERTKLIACQAVLEEIVQEVPAGIDVVSVDIALHVRPDSLRSALQEEIDRTSQEKDTILLGYGLCSRAVDGLVSPQQTLVVPRVHDCIGLLLNNSDERVGGGGDRARNLLPVQGLDRIR